ncbi:MAG: tripartite tricarboxylate transporter substrate binding protein [Ferrovibrio sp.]|uniref:Bug family tripartite tricarboxylate transporter substrate binding protein n=1 Tax=Ferrovibrio sp. TaxID=1917215 RepID=UPI0026160713|nr:tripartite tricarboxylate transporter substrate binding protein [Ferrovibrio sp.]MCW0232174.1 tripartite tricarboxylate transporter substrate binding protein [Ferrovibrio sp.]
MTFTRTFLAAAAAALLLAPAAPSAFAQAYPTKPVKVVVPFPAGGTTDILARHISAKLSERLGQQFVVDNRAGAGGNIGTEFTAKSEPDGYTIMMGTIGTHSINISLYSKLGYDPVKDFAPVSLVAMVANVLVVHPSVPAKNVQEFVALAKSQPGKLNFGTPGNGTSGHLSAELFKTMTGTDMVHVPYRGSGPMLTDLLGGNVQFTFDNLPSALPHIRSGALRALGVTTPKRWPSTPDIPTIAEQGLPDYSATAWFAMYAPAKTPAAIVAKLSDEIDAILKTPEMKAQFDQQGADPVGGKPQVLADLMKTEIDKWAKAVKASGARID